MTHNEFAAIDAALMKRCEEVLHQRGKAYASDADRFANFKEVAQQTGLTPLAVCHIYLLKGMSVVNKLMRSETVAGETVEERFSDAINYLRIGYAMRMAGEAVPAPTPNAILSCADPKLHDLPIYRNVPFRRCGCNA